MSYPRRGFTLVLGFALAALTACQDTFSPDRPGAPDGVRPQMAQGDDGLWTVNSLADPGDGTCDDTECTLREAITMAGDNGQIRFVSGLEGTILLTEGQLSAVDKDGVTIDGDGRITVDAQRLSRVFLVNGNSRPRLLTLKGLTVRGGATAQDGGGILVTAEAKLRLENAFVVDNETAENGGGIWVSTDSELHLINSTVDDNTSEKRGAGIYNQGLLTIIASTLSRNNALDGSGGGLAHVSVSPGIMIRSTVSGNFSQGGTAGGLFLDGDFTILSSTVVDNNSPGDHGGIFNGSSNPVAIGNSIVAGNQGSFPDCGGPFTSLGHNLTTTTGECDFFASGDLRVDAAGVFIQVLESELKNNGGPSNTHALIIRGRAMDAGYCPGETEDQRGLLRPVDIEVMANARDGCDIGAYEAQGPVIARTDLMVSQSADKVSVKAGDLLTYTVRVRNLGPELAPNAVLTNILSNGVTFVSATHAKGSHTAPPVGETGTVTWTLGDLLDQANETAEIKVTVRIKGKTSIVNTASVTADIVDLNPANNTASVRTTVGAGGGKTK